MRDLSGFFVVFLLLVPIPCSLSCWSAIINGIFTPIIYVINWLNIPCIIVLKKLIYLKLLILKLHICITSLRNNIPEFFLSLPLWHSEYILCEREESRLSWILEIMNPVRTILNKITGSSFRLLPRILILFRKNIPFQLNTATLYHKFIYFLISWWNNYKTVTKIELAPNKLLWCGWLP